MVPVQSVFFLVRLVTIKVGTRTPFFLCSGEHSFFLGLSGDNKSRQVNLVFFLGSVTGNWQDGTVEPILAAI